MCRLVVSLLSIARRGIALTILVAFGLATAPLLAQVDQGSVTGTVTDASGALIPKATVTLTDNDTSLTLTRTTSTSGFYAFTPVKVGNYTLKVSADGFASLVRSNLRVDVSQRLGVNASLKPGAASQLVTVTATPQLQTEDASTGQVFEATTINDTPLLLTTSIARERPRTIATSSGRRLAAPFGRTSCSSLAIPRRRSSRRM